MVSKDEVLEVLEENEALIVHFSGTPPMHHRDGVIYPLDLVNAAKEDFGGLACSVIKAGDTCANAIGSVGLILRPNSNCSVLYVSASDAGSSAVNVGGVRNGLGASPDRNSCHESIVQRPDNVYNEWGVRDYSVVGLFVFFPIQVWGLVNITGLPEYLQLDMKSSKDSVSINMCSVSENFTDYRYFTAKNGTFYELDGQGSQLRKVSSKEIYS